MKLCREIGRWIAETIERPMELLFERAYQLCAESRRWVEREVRTELSTWRERQEERCREDKCVWACLCCNKWVCWTVTVAVLVVEWVIQVVGEWLVEVVCNLVVTILRAVVTIIVQILKWVVLTLICIVESFCALFVFVGALALVVMLLAIVAMPAPALAAAAMPLIPVVAGIAATALAMARLLCRIDWCRIVGASGWAMKWAIVLGGALSIWWLSPLSALVVAIYGGLLAALIIALEKGKCRLPTMLGLP